MNLAIYSAGVSRKKKEPPNERAKWVRLVREETARMSQDDFAAAIKVARPTVSNWERGRYTLDWQSLAKIQKRFPSAPPPPFGPTRQERIDSLLDGMTDEGIEVAEYLSPKMDKATRQELRDAFHRLVQLRLARGAREA